MRLIDELRSEHELIEKVAGSLRTFVSQRVRDEGDHRDGERFLAFFRHYAGTFHHAREEDILLPVLVRELELPETSGPIRSLIDQHHSMAATLASVATLVSQEHLDDEEKVRLVSGSNDYVRSLWQHIDAENSVLLPEAEERLKWAGVHELPDREITEEEARARDWGPDLLSLYPPLPDPEAIRGEGCVICPSHGVSCEGLEREWWTGSEWETFEGRSG
ncbi:MAG: hemerythrin domain-containing protein [Thermoanaerobaculia bacterium]|nr:hemerythrin domain-containing protein [Thermoanaerobaculia bacterium]